MYSLLALLAVAATTMAQAPQTESPAATGAESPRGDDYIRTTTGIVFEGRITEETADKVTIQTSSGPVSIPRSIIEELRKADVDYRTPSQRIEAVEIPAGKEAEYVARAKAQLKEGKYEETAGVCKGLMDLAVTAKLTNEQRDTVGKVAAEAYFELKDWKAAAGGLVYASRAVDSEVDRDRIRAMAEALEQNEPPGIGGRTVESFTQAMSAAMDWKAAAIFEETKAFVADVKETHRDEIVKRALKAADQKLAQAESFVPGYSVQKWPHVCKAMAVQMVGTVEQATVVCEQEREEMTRVYWQKVISRRVAAAWNERCIAYLKLRQASEGCLENVQYIEDNQPLKMAFDDGEWKGFKEKRGKLTGKVEELKYYARNAKDVKNRDIHIKGKRIAPPKLSD